MYFRLLLVLMTGLLLVSGCSNKMDSAQPDNSPSVSRPDAEHEQDTAIQEVRKKYDYLEAKGTKKYH